MRSPSRLGNFVLFLFTLSLAAYLNSLPATISAVGMAGKPSTNPIAIGASPSSSSLSSAGSLPPAVQQLVQLHASADSCLHSPSLRSELASGQAGSSVAQARASLLSLVKAADALPSSSKGAKLSSEHQARALFSHAWALSRLGEYDGSSPSSLSSQLSSSLDIFQRAASLLHLPPPPALDSVPSVTRPQDPKRHAAGAGDLPEVQAWVAEMLAEWARAQTTFAFASLLSEDGTPKEVDPERLADLLDIACRRNVQALFTPVDPHSAPSSLSSSSSTVLGNARLLRDLLSLFPFTPSPSLWSRHLLWATHIADVRFVIASLSANALVDQASATAQILQSPNLSNGKKKEVKVVLEKLSRRIAPHERAQGNTLLWLGRVMLDACGVLYAGRTEGYQTERRKRDEEMEMDGGGHGEEEERDAPEFPENDLVRETRQVLIRAAALFENAYASILRAPPSVRRRKTELRLLRRLEATYIELETLDNSTPAVLELRAQRIDRAVLINERLIALGDAEDEEEGSDREHAEEEEEEEEVSSDEEEERLARRFGGQQLV